MRATARLVTAAAALAACASVPVTGAPAPSPAARAPAPERWTVCYTDRPSAFDLAAYDVIVLDPDHHPVLPPITERRRTVLAYLSLGEAERSRDFFANLRRAGILIGPNPTWPDASYLDLRRPDWTRLVLEDLVPRALASGFSGLFLDTLDDAVALETQDPARYRGMKRAASDLVLALRHEYPDIVLMANRGYDLMPQIAGSLDILLGESVLSTFDPETKAYHRVAADDAAWQISALREARRLNPRLRLFTLDYWDPADRSGVRRLYQEERTNGFVPYVSTRQLDSLVEEPQ